MKKKIFHLKEMANTINDKDFIKFKVADVVQIDKKIETIPLHKIMGKSYFSSPDKNKNICYLGSIPFLEGIYKAYCNHLPLLFTPDDFWLLIIQAFSNHVNKNSEKLRHLFVDFDGKKTLSAKINSDATKIEELTLDNFQDAINQLVNEIPEFVNKNLINAMHPDFSTTTNDINYVGSLSIMCTFKKYFKYEMDVCVCGIPSVTLKGTIQDWEKILEKLQLLRKYEFDNWIDEIEPIIKKLIETRKGNIDIDFWKNMIGQKVEKEVVYEDCMPDDDEYEVDVEYVYGWILKFFPFDKDQKYYIVNQIKPGDISDFASQILQIPFIINFSDSKYNMIFNAGFLGMEQNDKYEISSVVGYYITDGEKKD